MSGSTYCGAILVRDIEFPEVGRKIRKRYLSGKIEQREAFSFRAGGAGEVLYHSVTSDANGKELRRVSASTTYKRWRLWAADAEVVANQI